MTLRKLLLGCAALALITVPALAQRGPRDCGPKGACMSDRGGFAGLDLSADQKAKLRAIRAKHAVELNDRQQAVMDARTAFHTAAVKPETSAEALKKLYQPLADREYDLILAHRALRLEMRGVLTPEQQAKADAAAQTMPGPGKGHGRGAKR